MSDYINVLLYKDIQDEPNTLHGCFLELSYLTKATWERSALSRFVGGSEGGVCRSLLLWPCDSAFLFVWEA